MAQTQRGDNVVAAASAHGAWLSLSHYDFPGYAWQAEKSGGGDPVAVAIQTTIDPEFPGTTAPTLYTTSSAASIVGAGVQSTVGGMTDASIPIRGIRFLISSVSGSALVTWRLYAPGN